MKCVDDCDFSIHEYTRAHQRSLLIAFQKMFDKKKEKKKCFVVLEINKK